MVSNKNTPTLPVEIISRRELMERLGISEGQAIKLDKKGILKSFRLGGNVRYNWNKILEDLQNPENNGTE